MKHNKKRNTAFIYETLSRELTKAIVDKNPERKKEIVSIIKEFFNKGTVLAKELELYGVLLDTRNIKTALAERMLQETKRAHANLDSKGIFDTQSQIIAAINKSLGSEVWSNFVPNFKSLASVDAIFNPKTAVKKRVLFEQSIVDFMSAQEAKKRVDTLEPLDNLTYHSFIQKFNNRYGSLLQEQKDLLNQFITSFADDGFELRVYLNEELARLKKCVASSTNETQEVLITQKLKGLSGYLEELRKRDFTDTDLNKILKTQEVVRELASNDQD